MVRGTQRAGSSAKCTRYPSMALQHASPFSCRLPVGATPSCRHAASTTSGQVPSRARFCLSASTMSWSGGGSRAGSPTTVPMTSRETVSSTAGAATTVPMTSRETASSTAGAATTVPTTSRKTVSSTAGTASPDSTSLDVPRRVQQFNLAAQNVQSILVPHPRLPAETSFHLSSSVFDLLTAS